MVNIPLFLGFHTCQVGSRISSINGLKPKQHTAVQKSQVLEPLKQYRAGGNWEPIGLGVVQNPEDVFFKQLKKRIYVEDALLCKGMRSLQRLIFQVSILELWNEKLDRAASKVIKYVMGLFKV